MPEDKRLSQRPAVTSLADGDFFHVITDDGVGGYDTRRISKPNVKTTLGVQTQAEADDRLAAPLLRAGDRLNSVGCEGHVGRSFDSEALGIASLL